MDIDKQIELFERLTRIEGNTKDLPDLMVRVRKLEDGRLKDRAIMSGVAAGASALAKFILPCVLAFSFVHGAPPESLLVSTQPLIDYVTGAL